MRKEQILQRQINNLTTNIKIHYPELYFSISQNSVRISKVEPELQERDFRTLLTKLKQLLKDHIESNKIENRSKIQVARIYV